jgi:hypothetical protein
VHLAPSWSWPKPVQAPLPVLVGGAAGPTLFRHVVEYAQGWLPIGGAGLGDAVPRLRAAAAEAGRDPDRLRIVPFGSIPSPGKLDRFGSLGLEEVVLRVPSAPRDVALRALDEHVAAITEWRGSD